MRVSSPSDSATPSGVTGVAASADASEAPTGATGVPASADASTDHGDVYVGLSHANNACDGRDDATMFLVHDSGTSAHLVNDAALFIDGSRQSCYVRVYNMG